jgi:hypothetical protein
VDANRNFVKPTVGPALGRGLACFVYGRCGPASWQLGRASMIWGDSMTIKEEAEYVFTNLCGGDLDFAFRVSLRLEAVSRHLRSRSLQKPIEPPLVLLTQPASEQQPVVLPAGHQN